jgi:hypothetical protein
MDRLLRLTVKNVNYVKYARKFSVGRPTMVNKLQSWVV